MKKPLSESTISSVLSFSHRFLRSTDLSRDFSDPNGIEGYCLTDFARSCLNRISDGIREGSTRRAWRLTGDFGSGKSSFALLLANTLRDAKSRLPKRLRDEVLSEIPAASKKHYQPVLVVANRERMAPAVLRAFSVTLGELYVRGTKSLIENQVSQALDKSDLSDKEALALIAGCVAKIVDSGKADGVLLILDEAGKFLEYAALHPDKQDVFFLQQLAELATRSGSRPLMVFCLLHQGFNAYAEQMAQSTQQEWEKIAGRFDEILFRQPLDQVALLVASALNSSSAEIPKKQLEAMNAILEKSLELGWYGTAASRVTLRKAIQRIYPIDPLLLPIIVRIFQRFGQNERSLFGFLLSHEPFGLRAFSESSLLDSNKTYQLADFYDYVRSNFGHRLAVASYRTHWNVIESVIESRIADDPLELKILKTIGILNLLNVDDLKPTEDAICWAVVGADTSSNPHAPIKEELKRLVDARVLHFRGAARGYALWPFTSVDIDAQIEESKRAIPSLQSVAGVIAEQLTTQPIVARSHYIKTGNLRYFDVVYCKSSALQETAYFYTTKADGFVLVPLCETLAETKDAKLCAASLKEHESLIRIIAVPQPLNHLKQAAMDSLRWDWVRQNTPELNNDKFAREEVEIHRQEARYRLQHQVQSFVGINRMSRSSSLSWFYHDHEGLAKDCKLASGRQVISLLSTLCDHTFSAAPQIKNELVNRQSLSPAAASARIRLLDLMFTKSDCFELGLPSERKPPEKSMYLSVLKNTQLHSKDKSGEWKFLIPSNSTKSDTCNVGPVIRKMLEILKANPDVRVPVKDIFKELQRRPYGLRAGLFPLFLGVIAVACKEDLAFYENGTFLREVSKDAFMRLAKVPEKFEVQYCRIEGIRAELFKNLAEVVLQSGTSDRKVELLDIVRSLCQFVAGLPEYSRNTKRLSPQSQEIRRIILDAREPVRMVFHDLPAACGLPPFHSDAALKKEDVVRYVEALQEGLQELRGLFTELHQKMLRQIIVELGAPEASPHAMRSALSERATRLLVRVTDNKLKAFAFRVFDVVLPINDWLNSIGSVLALRPPDKWKDEDEDRFVRELETMSGRFKRAESVAFAQESNPSSDAVRVAVTRSDGTEKQEVIYVDQADQLHLEAIEIELRKLLSKNPRLGVAAATRAIWDHIKSSNDEDETNG